MIAKLMPVGARRLVGCSSSLRVGLGEPGIMNLAGKRRDEICVIVNENLSIRNPHVVSRAVRAGINLNPMGDPVMISQNLTSLRTRAKLPTKRMGHLDLLPLGISLP